LVDAERQALRRNQKPIPADIETQIESRVAERLPLGWVYDPDDPDGEADHIPGKTLITATVAVAKSARILKAWQNLGVKKVAPSEAESRAACCMKCPMRIAVGCLTCNGVHDILERMMGMMRTSRDDHLNVCGADGVFNRTHIWFPKELFVALLPKGARPNMKNHPGSCWKRQLLEVKEPTNEPAKQ
jgi:hypothetical protein